jgi:Fe2+ or Zn2+ uptake regulation protein
MTSLDALLEQFRQKGLRITPQRRVILDLLVNDASHPTAEEVYQRVLAVMPTISRTTVYNTVGELIDLGVLTPVHNLNAEGQRYDTNTDMHHHLYCVACHKLIDLACDFEGLRLSDEQTSGYQILNRQVTFYALCPDCQAADKEL